MPQHRETMHPGGWKRFVRFPRLYDVWLVASGRVSLHRAWQSGYDQHIIDDGIRRAALERCESRMSGHPMWDSEDAGPSKTLQIVREALDH